MHRDLKPANVKITPDGVVKVLDFGLATAAVESTAGDAASSPTLTISPTRDGTILGTAAYMAPEQARGATVDKRADIWAFGVVLYEMLTGKPMFSGETVSDILAGVLRAEPDWSALPADTPPSVRRLLRRCLERDRKRRLRDIGDARLEMDEAPEAAPRVTPARRHPLPWVIAAVLAGGADRSVLVPAAPCAGRAPAAGFAVDRHAAQLLRFGRRVVPRWHAAGVCRADRGRGTADAADAGSTGMPKPLAGTAGAVGPVFSPDGQWIAFYEGERLKKIPVTGGPPDTVCKAVGQRGRTWGDDDTIVFGTIDGGLMRVPAAGGVPQKLTTPNRQKGETSHQWPHFLPGARAIVFTIVIGGSYDTAQIGVLDLEHGSYRTVVNGGSIGRYAPTGHLVFARVRKAVRGAVRCQATGGHGTRDAGDPRPWRMVPSALPVTRSRIPAFWYIPGVRPRTGPDHRVGGPQRGPAGLPCCLHARIPTIRLSPDGRRMAASIASSDTGRRDIWMGDLERGTLTRLTSEDWNFSPVWTPDGRRITFGSSRGGKNVIHQVAADGAACRKSLFEGERPDVSAVLDAGRGGAPVPGQGPGRGADLDVAGAREGRCRKAAPDVAE